MKVGVVEGKSSYGASTKNGVASIPYGAYFASIQLKKSGMPIRVG